MAKRLNAYPRDSTENLYDAVDFLRGLAVDRLHQDLAQKIGTELGAGRPLRVGFLVNDRSKWNCDSLLEEIRRAGWSARLYLCLSDARYADGEERRVAYQAEREFFLKIDNDLEDLYDSREDRVIPVEDVVTTDVTFLQQPWGMKDFPRRLAGRTLSAYMHYGFMIMANHGMHYHIGSFHPYLWRYFEQTEEHRLLHLSHDPSAYGKAVVSGYPKLDVYLAEGNPTSVWPVADRSVRRVIYAPHHSLGKDNLGMSTFAWTHQRLLELAKETPGLQWVYKPHPTLRYSVARNKVMTREEYHLYESAWSQLPNATVYDSGGYFDLFRTSDAVITDSGSFLAEYLPTGRPIVWLVSAGSVGFNSVGQSFSEAFYKARSLPEFEEIFRSVVVEGKDPLEEVRSRVAQRLVPAGRAATAIVEHLRDSLTSGATRPESYQRPSVQEIAR